MDTLLSSGVATPIAQLGPDLADQKPRVIRGEVTIIWPYNSVKRSLAFLLAESDVRLRRSKGQVRIQLNGSSAQSVASCGLGGGDEVALSLEGVEWVKDDSTANLPPSRVEWQLQYGERLVLQAKVGDSQAVKAIDVDHPVVQQEAIPTNAALDSPVEPAEPLLPEVGTVKYAPMLQNIDLEEFSSPAFIKRARVSYGALFEGPLDQFDEDGSVRGKGRKRTRFGRASNAWRYSSQSQSPEREEPRSEKAVDDEEPAQAPPAAQRPMLDEGVQTVGLDLIPDTRLAPSTAAQPDIPPAPILIDDPLEDRAGPPANIPTQEAPLSDGLTKSSAPFGSALFGTYTSVAEAFPPTLLPVAPGTGGFGTSVVPLADQVRFGFAESPSTFSFAPRTAIPPPSALSPPKTLPLAAQSSVGIQGHYPEAYLDEPVHPTDLDAQPVAATLQSVSSGFGVPSHPDANGSADQGHLSVWPITSKTFDDEDAVAQVEVDPALRGSSTLPPLGENSEPSGTAVPTDHMPREADDYGYNQRRYQNEAEERTVHLEERTSHRKNTTADSDDVDDPEADYEDEVANEAGDDYDMRNYTNVDDDEEGYEEFENEESGAYGGEAQLFNGGSSDAEGSYDEEDDEGEYYSTDEDEEPMTAPQPVPAARGSPEVIDLISDSEDEVAAPPPPRPRALQASQLGVPPPASIQQNSESQSYSDGESDGGYGTAPRQQQSNSPPFVKDAQVIDYGMTGGVEGTGGDQGEEDSPSYNVGSDDSSKDIEVKLLPEQGDAAAEGGMELDEEEADDETIELSERDEPDDEEDEAMDDAEAAEDEAEETVSEAELEATLEAELEAERLVDLEAAERGAVEGGLDPSTDIQVSTGTEIISHQSQSGEAVVLQTSIAVAVQSLGPVDKGPYQPDPAKAQPSEVLGRIQESPAVSTGPVSQQIAPEQSILVEAKEDQKASNDELQSKSGLAGIAGAVVDGPTSPPLTQRSFESQTFHKLLSSPPPASQDQPEQLPTPFGTQPSDLILSQQAAFGHTNEEVSSSERIPSPHTNPLPVYLEDERANATSLMEAEITSSQIPTSEVVVEEESREPPPDAAPLQEVIPGTPEDLSVVRLPPPPSLIQEVELSEPLPDKMEVDGEDMSVVHLPPPTAQEMEDEARLKEKEACISQDIQSQPSSQASQQKAMEDSDAMEEVADLTSSQVTQAQPEKEDDAVEDTTPARATRTKAKKAGATKASPKSMAVAPDLSVEIARGSRRATRAQKQAPSPSLSLPKTDSFMKAPSPEAPDPSLQLAKAALQSPSKAKATATLTALKSELTKSLRSDLPECLPLQNLNYHLGKLVEIVAVATTDSTTPQRTKTRQFFLSFNITDPSTAPSHVIETQIYRAHKDSLPTVRAGDGILLRNMEIVAMTNKGFGLRSQEESGYAVFSAEGGSPQIKGPPLEDIDTEDKYVARLMEWYGLVDKVKVGAANKKLTAASPKKK